MCPAYVRMSHETDLGSWKFQKNDGHRRGGCEENFSRKWVVAKIESRMDVVILNLLPW